MDEICPRGSFHLDANDSNSITLSENDVAEWADLSGNRYDMIAQGHPTREDYGYGTDLKVVRFEKSGRDALYSPKKWDTGTGDFTMFAVARYSSDNSNQAKVITDRIRGSWTFGFGAGKVGYYHLGDVVSDTN